ncbi:MAG: hypothetical protein ACK5OB_16440 [Pirellula sp.]
MNFIKTLISIIATLPTIALAGDWSSGGGAILRNANNPWFLENTKEVSYCIKFDTKSFSDLPTPLPEIVETAFKYWKTQMSDLNATTNGYPISKDPKVDYVIIRVATQKFAYNAKCSGNEDITFQFGVLDSKQKKFFGKSSGIIGAAVRTDYDEVNLKGKGFVYITADKGSNQYEGDHLRPNAWHEGKSGLLFRAVVHELGHVFGLSHGGEGIMAESYSESLLRDRAVPAEYANGFELPNFFHFNLSPMLSSQLMGSEICQGEMAKKLFGTEFQCPFSRLKQDGPDRFLLVAKPPGSDEEKLIGTLEGKTSLRVPGNGFGVSVVLTDRQNVYSENANNHLRLRGPSLHMGRFVGKFKPAFNGGKTFTAVLILSPEAATFDGVVDGEYLTNIMNWSFSSIGRF